MVNDLAKHKKEESILETNWLDRLAQREDPFREVYDLLIELGQQEQSSQPKTSIAEREG